MNNGCFGFRLDGIDLIFPIPENPEPENFGCEIIDFLCDIDFRLLYTLIKKLDDREPKSGEEYYESIVCENFEDIIHLDEVNKGYFDNVKERLLSSKCSWSYIIDFKTGMLEVYANPDLISISDRSRIDKLKGRTKKSLKDFEIEIYRSYYVMMVGRINIDNIINSKTYNESYKYFKKRIYVKWKII